jgi:hypothetical protein
VAPPAPPPSPAAPASSEPAPRPVDAPRHAATKGKHLAKTPR